MKILIFTTLQLSIHSEQQPDIEIVVQGTLFTPQNYQDKEGIRWPPRDLNPSGETD